MGISLKGHAPDFQYWVFDIDGKTWVAVNQSSTQPQLNINFVGNYRNWPSSLPLINTSGFLINGSSTKTTNDIGEKTGTVEWVWAGKRYLSTWVLTAGREISPADPEEGVPATFEYGLNFVGLVPYEGPAGGAVGTGGVTNTQSPPPPSIPTPVPSLPIDGSNATAVDETKEALVAANKALATSEAQGRINVQALNTARVELQNAKDALSAAQARSTADQAVMMSRLQEQLQAIEERTQIQINVYRQAMEQAQRTPPATTPVTSPVVTPPTTPSVSPAGADWVKLGLQLGAAYLLLS